MKRIGLALAIGIVLLLLTQGVSAQDYLEFGGTGSSAGLFNDPQDIDTAGGLIYIVDHDNNRIQIIDSGGTFLGEWGSYGSGPGQFDDIGGIEVIPAPLVEDIIVLVVDKNNSRIQQFDYMGNYLGERSVPALRECYDVAHDPQSGLVFVSCTDRFYAMDQTGVVDEVHHPLMGSDAIFLGIDVGKIGDETFIGVATASSMAGGEQPRYSFFVIEEGVINHFNDLESLLGRVGSSSIPFYFPLNLALLTADLFILSMALTYTHQCKDIHQK
jgi:hypothetical protein